MASDVWWWALFVKRANICAWARREQVLSLLSALYRASDVKPTTCISVGEGHVVLVSALYAATHE